MSKSLVTGGAGFIGSNLVDALIEKGHEVLVIDNLSTGKKENLNPQAKFFEADLRELDKIKPLFEGVDYVFHQAALPRIPLSIEKPVETNDINIKGTLNVLVASKDAGVKKVIYASSSSALGGKATLPMREDAPCDPLNPYSLQKYVGELYCNIFPDIYGLPTVSLRYFNCYDDKTEVLTEDGFKYFKDITFADKIATLNPKTNELEYHKPFAIQKYKYRGEMLYFNLESVDLMVTPDHNLYIKKKGKKFYLFKANKILREKGAYSWKMKQDCLWKGNNRDFEVIPAVKFEDGRQREEHKEKKIPIKLWLKFLGWFLSEGSVFSGITTNYGKKVRYYKVTITQGNKKNYKEIFSLVKQIGFKSYLGSNKRDIIISSKQLHQHLKKFKKNKYIPQNIKNLDRSLLKILFNTLMRGDGNKNGRRYTTKYKQFADDFQELLLKVGKVGKVGKIVKENPHKHYKKIYRIYIKNHHFQPQLGDNYKKKLYLKKVKYNNLVYDLTVPNHIMLVRRNGKIVWSGNCYGPRQPREGTYTPVIGIFLTQKKQGQPLTITGDGEQTRDWTHVFDVARANILAMESDKVGKGEVINIGAGENHSVNEIARMIGGETTNIPARPGEMRDTLAETTRAKELLGWQPEISLADGIKQLLENER